MGIVMSKGGGFVRLCGCEFRLHNTSLHAQTNAHLVSTVFFLSICSQYCNPKNHSINRTSKTRFSPLLIENM